MSALQRQQLRQQLRHQRRSLSVHQQQQAAKKICQQILKLKAFKQAQRIAFYQAADGELNPRYVLKLALAYGKHCYLPVLRRFPKQELAFVRVSKHSRLCKHRFGFKEPKQRPRLFIYQLDMICMPLVGFDNQGQRLGMGGGFYDKSLAHYQQKAVFKLGLAHDCQQVKRVPSASWDIALNGILTPTRYIAT